LAARPCTFCGAEVTSANAAVDYCRECHYGGRQHARTHAGLLAELEAATGVPAEVWHVGGGCFVLVAAYGPEGPAGSEYEGCSWPLATLVAASYEAGEGWQGGDPVLPEGACGPWCLTTFPSLAAWAGEAEVPAAVLPLSSSSVVSRTALALAELARPWVAAAHPEAVRTSVDRVVGEAEYVVSVWAAAEAVDPWLVYSLAEALALAPEGVQGRGGVA